MDGHTVGRRRLGAGRNGRALVGYSLGAGLNVRWLALDAPEEFTRIATRLHAGIHGDRGDGGKLGDKQRDIYEHVLASNAENIVDEVRPEDIVILHDPPTAGLAKALKAVGATVIWRCHAGAEGAGEAADYAWAFLDRYLEDVDLVIVSRPEYRPPYIEAERCAVLAPSIDADSPKNRVLDLDEAWSVARLSGIFTGEPPFEAVPFMRHDGRADAFRGLADDPVLAGGPVPLGARVVTQVNRWDRLKGGLELVEAFAENIAVLPEDAHLLLVGPTPDGPESQATLTQIVERCSVLPESVASRIHVAAVSMEDREVNATVVNAVQRVSSVVTQRSLIEAFGLTVAEAMWKKAPVVASAVGGSPRSDRRGVDGVLVTRPTVSPGRRPCATCCSSPSGPRRWGWSPTSPCAGSSCPTGTCRTSCRSWPTWWADEPTTRHLAVGHSEGAADRRRLRRPRRTDQRPRRPTPTHKHS